MLMFGDHTVRPMTFLPLHTLSSVAPASHSARASTPMMAPISRASESLKVAPKLTELGKEVGQKTVPLTSRSKAATTRYLSEEALYTVETPARTCAYWESEHFGAVTYMRRYQLRARAAGRESSTAQPHVASRR